MDKEQWDESVQPKDERLQYKGLRITDADKILNTPLKPKESEILAKCPDCGGLHFNITEKGTLICTSVIIDNKVAGCGWSGKGAHLTALETHIDNIKSARRSHEKEVFIIDDVGELDLKLYAAIDAATEESK